VAEPAVEMVVVAMAVDVKAGAATALERGVARQVVAEKEVRTAEGAEVAVRAGE